MADGDGTEGAGAPPPGVRRMVGRGPIKATRVATTRTAATKDAPEDLTEEQKIAAIREALNKKETLSVRTLTQHYASYAEQLRKIQNNVSLLIKEQEELNEVQFHSIEQSQRQIKIEIELADAEKKDYEAKLKQLENLRKLGLLTSEYAKELMKALDIKEEDFNVTELLNKKFKELEKTQKKLSERQKSLNNGVSVGTGLMEGLAGSVGIVKDNYSNFFEAMSSKEGFAGLTKGIKESAAETFSLSRIAGSLVKTVVDSTLTMMKKVDESQAKAKKAFGPDTAVEGFIKNTNLLEEGLRLSGVEYDQAMQAAQDVFAGYSRFEEAASEDNGKLAKTLISDAALFDKAGIATNEYVGTINDLVMSYGQSGDEAVRTVRTLTQLSSVLRKPKAQIIKDLNEMNGFLSKYGRNSIAYFKELETVSTRTGISMSTLASTAEGLSTLGGIQEKVAGFNALLTGAGAGDAASLLNSIEVLNEADPIKQQQMFFDAIRKSKIDIDDQNMRFVLSELASKIGMSVKDLKAGVRGFDLKDEVIKEKQEQIDQTGGLTDEALKEQTQASMGITEKIGGLVQSMIVSVDTQEKILTGIHKLLNKAMGIQEEDPNALFNAGAAGIGSLQQAPTIASTVSKGASTVSKGAGFVSNLFSGASSAAAAGSSALNTASGVSQAGSAVAGAGEATALLNAAGQVLGDGVKESLPLAKSGRIARALSTLFGGVGKRAAPLLQMAKSIPGAQFAPLIGPILNFLAAAHEYVKTGEMSGRIGLNLTAGLLGLPIPGVQPWGGVLSGILNAGMLAYDLYGWYNSPEEGASPEAAAPESGTGMATGGVVTKEISNVTMGERNRAEAVIPLQDGYNHLAEPLQMALEKFASSNTGPSRNVTPKIELTVVLEGSELRSYVKKVIGETLNPFT